MRLIPWAIAALAYVVLSQALFHGPAMPVAYLALLHDRLGIGHWRWIAALCAAPAALVLAGPLRRAVPASLRPAAFVSLALLLPTLGIGTYADGLRREASLALGADRVDGRSFFASLRAGPGRSSGPPHAVAIKGCRIHAWSYRTLSFHGVPAGPIDAGPLAGQWLTLCDRGGFPR